MKLFCVMPGPDFSRCFVESWTSLFRSLLSNSIEVETCTGYSPILHEVRNLCMGGSVSRGKRQQPFGGSHYDYILFMDHDQQFDPSDFYKLVGHDCDIVGGWYPLVFGNGAFTSCGIWNGNGTNPLLPTKKLVFWNKPGLLEVAFSGFGFLLVKRGVFESIDYPWFYPTMDELVSIASKFGADYIDTIREDICWCEKVQNAGFNVFIDPKVRIGHEKRVIL